jgi:hypothetical protein
LTSIRASSTPRRRPPAPRYDLAQELVNVRRVQGFRLAEILDGDAEAPVPRIATEYIDGYLRPKEIDRLLRAKATDPEEVVPMTDAVASRL